MLGGGGMGGLTKYDFYMKLIHNMIYQIYNIMFILYVHFWEVGEKEERTGRAKLCTDILFRH